MESRGCLLGCVLLTFGSRATCSRALWLLNDLELVGELAALGRHSRHLGRGQFLKAIHCVEMFVDDDVYRFTRQLAGWRLA